MAGRCGPVKLTGNVQSCYSLPECIAVSRSKRMDNPFTALPKEIIEWLVVLFLCLIVLKYLRYRRAKRRQQKMIADEVKKQLEEKYYKN